MPEDLYGDGDDSQAPAPAPDPKPDDSGQKTCLLPKSAFPDAKPGDKLTVEVLRVHDDEVEVCPEGCGDEKSPEPPAEQPSESEGSGGMRSMLED